MGNLIWHEYSRLPAITASVYAIWASFFGLFYRKFFWDFVGGTLRDPGGLQPAPGAAIFINIIVKVPIVQIITMILAMFILALEFPLPQLKSLAIHRSIVLRIVLLLFQTFLSILFYQVSFETARDSGDLFFFPSTTTKLPALGVEFQVRLCPALQKKPPLPPPDLEALEADSTTKANRSENRERSRADPFIAPYNTKLYLGDLQDEDGAEYVVLLNKYAIVPNHFLLVTKEFQLQSSPLLPSDLVQAYMMLIAAQKTGQRFFAFYNCGEHSGASQPHKHIQFIPAEDDGPPIERLARSAHIEVADKPFSLSSLPYANHIFRFPSNLQSSTPSKIEHVLSTAVLSLLDLAISTIRHAPEYPPGKPSYNVILTIDHVHLIPRRFHEYTLPETGETISVNALGYAGLLLVKSEEELAAVKAEGIGKILGSVGLESVHDIQVAETTAEAE
ncbi:ATP adenylyltransferase-domain-containing protein [Lyophyllum atratum]|nr:ATP adenylyltransferase-domain-containing protein [Lyophyllum atratum]